LIPRSVDRTDEPTTYLAKHAFGKRTEKKKKFFFSYAALALAATPLAARPPFLPKNDPPSIAYLPDRILPKIHATKNKIYFFINFIL
jgi:hypothetical protein